MTDSSRPSSFDFGAATLQGLNLPGGKSYIFRVAAWTAIVLTCLYVALGTPIVRAFVEVVQNAIEMELPIDDAEPDPEVVFAMMAPMFRAVGLIFLISLLQMFVFAAAETAIYRNLFHGEDRGVFPLTFGIDELRVLGSRIVVGFIVGGVYMGLYLVGVIAGLIIFGIAGATGSGGITALGGILVFFLFLGAVGVIIWVAVRLAPTSAYSVKLRAFNPVASWAPMQGKVWPAIGSFLILYFVGYFIISFAIGIVFLFMFLASGILKPLMELDTTSTEIPDFSGVWAQVSSAGFIIPMVIGVFLAIFLSLLWWGMIWSMWGYFAKSDHMSNDASQIDYPVFEPEIWTPQ